MGINGSTMKTIDQFRGAYAFLSNFWDCSIEYEGIVYPSVENAYQASKSLDPATRLKISTMTAGQAKRFGKQLKDKGLVREDWYQINLKIMYDLNKIKFTNPELADLLKATGSATLIEGNTWGDTFWGQCRGKGENHLGKTLMKIRSKL